MKVNRDEVRNVRTVNVNVEGSQVARLVCDLVARNLLIDPKVADQHLSVEFNSHHDAYVRGEVPLTRDQLLESLGLTPTEPVETDGAAVAQDLGDHVVGTSDVAETPETLAAFEAVAGDPDQLLKAEREQLVADNERAPVWGAAVGARLEHIQEIDRSLKQSDNVLRSEDVSTVVRDDTTPETLQKALARVTELVDTMRSMPARVETLVALRRTARDSLDRDPLSRGGRALLKVVEALEGDVGLVYPGQPAQVSEELPEVQVEQRLVPRPVSEDNLRQARLKLAELADGPRIAAGRANAADLHYVLSLLGGEL